MELQRVSCGLAEVKFASDKPEEMTFSGYGAVFGNVDSYGDVIAPGAFAETLAAAKNGGQFPAMLSQHGGFGLSAEDMMPIGIWTDLVEDGTGLRATGRLANTPRGREAYELLKMQPRPALNGLSIGYIPKEWTARSKPDEPRRTLKKVDLLEISVVTFPANPKARVQSVKSIEDLNTLAEAERYLRDACGLSRSEAVAFVSRCKRLGPSDSDGHDDTLAALQRLASRMAVTKEKTKYKVGDRVTVKPGKNHNEMTKDKVGTVKEISTEALGVKFDGMDEMHKWYVDDEVQSA